MHAQLHKWTEQPQVAHRHLSFKCGVIPRGFHPGVLWSHSKYNCGVVVKSTCSVVMPCVYIMFGNLWGTYPFWVSMFMSVNKDKLKGGRWSVSSRMKGTHLCVRHAVHDAKQRLFLFQCWKQVWVSCQIGWEQSSERRDTGKGVSEGCRGRERTWAA